jgi:hypothetical protein
MQQQRDRPLLDIERTILAKERATLLDRLRLVETLLGVPPSVPSSRERERQRRAGAHWGRNGYTTEDEG